MLRQQVHELLAGQLRSFSLKRSTHTAVRSECVEHAPALAQIREPGRRILGRRCLGHQVLARQRLEREHDRGLAGVRRQRAGPRDQRAVPEVNAIEAAHRDGGSSMMGLQAL